jgi:hypothetical protein
MSRAPEPPRPGTRPSAASASPSHAERADGASSASLALQDEDFGPRTEALRQDLLRRLSAWGRPVVVRLRDAGMAAAAQVVETETALCLVFAGEAPADVGQGAGLSPQESAGKSPAKSARGRVSLALMLCVEVERVRAGLELPPSRARGVRTALANPEKARELGTAFEALPEQFEVSVEGDAAPVQAPRCSADDLRAMLDRAAQGGQPLWIGWTVRSAGRFRATSRFTIRRCSTSN